MSKHIRSFCILICFLGSAPAFSQSGDLQVSGAYVHEPTKVEFPERTGQYRRVSLTAYNNERTDVGASYEWWSSTGQVLITVYVYPAGDGSEGSLRGAYWSAVNDMKSTVGEVYPVFQNHRAFSTDGFKINGFSGTIVRSPFSRVTVFECGQWFFKMRTTAALPDSADVTVLEAHMLDTFQPTRMVKGFPLNLRGQVTVAEGALRDSVMLKCTLASAFKKLSWAKQNVDSVERLSGFPDLYLGLHVESFKTFVELANQSTEKRKSGTKKYASELSLLLESGYIEEFIVEQFDGVIIVPKETVLDAEGYQLWRRKHKIKINLVERYYLVGYKAI